MYPSIEEVQYYNTIAIEMFRKSKHDQAKTINNHFIENVLDTVKDTGEDLYDKAAILLFELTHIHAFESGNKRTAFLTTKKFILQNDGKFNIPDTTDNARIMIGIREQYYSLEEIREWIENGRIKEFRR
jgi:death-on-curing family protein